jgi:hypothetical protein
MTVNDVTQRKEKDYRRNGEQCCKARAEGWGVYRTKTSLELFVAALTAVIQMAAPLFYVAMVVNTFLGNHVPLFLWQRFSDVIHRHITAAGLRYRYPRKHWLKEENSCLLTESFIWRIWFPSYAGNIFSHLVYVPL